MIDSVFKCNADQLKEYLVKCIQNELVPFVQSSPGVGKSEIIKQLAEEYNLKLIDFRLATADPTDLLGLPRFTENRAEFVPFDNFPLETTPLVEGTSGWLLFLDEFNSAPRQVQAACYKLILDREIGNHKIHPQCAIVAAGNLTGDRAITNQLSTAMQSRLVHIELDCSHSHWVKNVALPRKYDPRILAYLQMYPERLMDFDPKHTNKTFSCPRSWDFMNRLIKGEEDLDTLIPLLTGTITPGVALEFVQFSKVYKDMVSTDEILNKPLKAILPDSLEKKWALVSALMQISNDITFQPISMYIDRLDKSFRILYYRWVSANEPDLVQHPRYKEVMREIAQWIEL